MGIINVTGYKFVALQHIESLRQALLEICQLLALKGTILLSEEGININIAGDATSLSQFKTQLKVNRCFADITFRENHSVIQPFRYLKVKIKKEIITLRQPTIQPVHRRAPSITPEELKQWLDEKRAIMLFDTRNDYEVQWGTFTGAIHLNLSQFSELPAAIKKFNRHQPIVTVCTGGIRCEKAALCMLDHGFSDVYQLEGGILNYFSKVGRAHYTGKCFVFDERIAV